MDKQSGLAKPTAPLAKQWQPAQRVNAPLSNPYIFFYVGHRRFLNDGHQRRICLWQISSFVQPLHIFSQSVLHSKNAFLFFRKNPYACLPHTYFETEEIQPQKNADSSIPLSALS